MIRIGAIAICWSGGGAGGGGGGGGAALDAFGGCFLLM